MKIRSAPELGPLTTFVLNKKLPLYNWFYYKEGFSRDLVRYLLDRFKPTTVLDPFCGVGTTLLACKEAGITSIGLDTSPVALLASTVKTQSFDTKLLAQEIKALSKARFQLPDNPIPRNISRFYNPHTLNDILFFRNQLQQVDPAVRDFLLLGLVSSSAKCSYIYRDGAVLKVRKKPVPSFRKFYLRFLRRMLREYRHFPQTTIPRVIPGDARSLPLKTSVDAVITSPPYLNKIEYTTIYAPEEFLFFNTSNKPLRSYIGLDAHQNMFPGLPSAAQAYMADMQQVLKELYRVCSPGANLALVVGNACFPDRVLDVDTLLAKEAEHIGFTCLEILAVNERWCTKNRTQKIGRVRESIIFLKK